MIIEHLAGAKIFSKINFTQYLYHHPIIADTDDIENTAITMRYGNGLLYDFIGEFSIIFIR